MKRPNDFDNSDSSKKSRIDDSSSDEEYSSSSSEYVDSSDDLDILNENEISTKITKMILKHILNDFKLKRIYKYDDICDYLNKDKSYIVNNTSLNITKKIFTDIKYDIFDEYNINKKTDIKKFLKNKLNSLYEEQKEIEDKANNNDIVLKFFPISTLTSKNFKREDENYEEESKLDKEFTTFLKDGIITPKNDLNYFKKLSDKEKKKYIDGINKIKKIYKIDKPKILQIIESSNTLNNKSIILNKMQKFDSLSSFSSEYFKLKNWVDGIVQIPFGIYKQNPVSKDSSKLKIREYLNKVKNHMDDAVYGHEEAKKQILQIMAHTISNPNDGGTIIAIQGPPGVGKTQLIQDGISKALGRPFEFISLGGATDSSFLEGHDYTYEGSKPGKIVEVLQKAKCMNPVIFFDELDKVSETAKGSEIINILTHLTDSTQNHHFNDKYYSGIDFDLSKCIFIFSFNDEYKINRILKDRMYIIRTKGFQSKEKIKIAKNYLIPKLLKSVGFKNNDIIFSDRIINLIIENYTYEGGVRRLKESLFEIIKEVNLRNLSHTKILNKYIKYPLKITSSMIKKDFFKKRNIVKEEKIHDVPKIGLVNGLWANELGVGGLIPIESFIIPTLNKLELELTGSQGDVMKESMKVAKTVAWNILPDKVKNELNENWKKFGNTGIHIHCPDGSTPKDGPSAGAAITTAIISLLLNEPINNKIAMTGEINLKGMVTKIGGLTEKLIGAKKAGAELVLIPKENQDDLNKLVNSDNNPLSEKFKVFLVDNIWDVLNICFMKKIVLKKY